MQVGEVLEIPVRRRVLPSATAEAADGLDTVFRDIAAKTGLRCWLISGMGRVIGPVTLVPVGDSGVTEGCPGRCGRRRARAAPLPSALRGWPTAASAW